MEEVSLKGKHLLGLQGRSKEEIELILRVAKKMKRVILSDDKKIPYLKGKSIINLFMEPSTRTRSSFELAGKYLGADVINITPSGSSMVKGESFRDTLLTVSYMGTDAIVMRHKAEGAPLYATKAVEPIIINAGDGAHEHPTQALLDMYSILEKKPSLEGLKIVIVGDIMHSRVARSDIYGMTTMGADVHLAGPRTLVYPELEKMGVTVHHDIREAVQGADVINVLRIQLERIDEALYPTNREYARIFGINREILQLAKKDVMVLHPGPMNRGLEIAPDVAYSDESMIQEQVRNGVAIRMAVLYLTIHGGDGSELAD
ncbi:aspartate carbamoyltransferase [Veillonella montpellierensis DNF00314]|uniref:Aspartate carbamoyltransferase n=1 Tax=Veillonella montpellierensis DNF00314 TaxID=1401067 RepID=A0A096AIW5_9FIRM|nr:aspartate carbamoyltransferase catalytic subunit [Veillonella montpellierensis]KGF47063.1 aspartate carbamoyltransferase [Veillonella montpellierensis DNF00314]